MDKNDNSEEEYALHNGSSKKIKFLNHVITMTLHVTMTLKQGYRYHKLRKTFSKIYRRHYGLISKFNIGLKTLLREGRSEPEFYKELKGRNYFSFQLRNIITRYRHIAYKLNVMRQSVCLVFNPFM